MRTRRLHWLKKTKVRQTWNKYNLYNLSKLYSATIRITNGKFFQQKWKSRSLTRAYHGEQLRESHWKRMFRPTLRSVIPMDHRYLAEYDGSELAAGRGSGKDVPSIAPNSQNQMPYMNMTFAPLERRLDTAIFRALFASSTRQARQFVIHGNVKVNGKRMIYPGYLLNPGDMFQVEPDRVLFATGAPKDREQIVKGRGLIRAMQNSIKSKQAAVKAKATKVEEETETPASEEQTEEQTEDVDGGVVLKEQRTDRKLKMKRLIDQAKALISATGSNTPSAKRKQQLRELTRKIRNAVVKANRQPVDVLDTQLSTFMSQLVIKDTESKSDDSNEASENNQVATHTEEELNEALRRASENPIDGSKPYATPWRPRPFMSAFAFIPRYLEVNQNICSAVYLRHPVARPGLAEVPSPFGGDIQQLAYTWYLRRR
ncbi:hypothetical protein B7494_g6114 [Chlorociboria aeruginascens]|nr:hypothetical protein B7494_g6114 [Chlorociboria aeruginascens]